MFIGWMFHVHAIKFLIHIVIGVPPPILVICSNHALLFIDEPGLKFVKYLNITLSGVPSFSVSASLGYFTSYYFYCCKGRIFVFI